MQKQSPNSANRARNDACGRLTTIPRVGPVTATALVAAIGAWTAFRKGRDLAAWARIVFYLPFQDTMVSAASVSVATTLIHPNLYNRFFIP